VIARMLGLEVRAMSVADTEIVQRLEKLILANQASASSTFILDTNVNDVVEGFRRGYDMPGNDLHLPSSPQRGRQEAKSGGVAARSRSLSPNKKRDSKVY